MLKKWINKKITNYLSKKITPTREHLCNFDTLSYEIRPADVLLVEGTSRISAVINSITKSAWSHSALYIGRIHDIEDPTLRELIHQKYQGSPHEQLVVESWINKGTIITPLKAYKHDHLRICRPTGITQQDTQEVIRYAVTHIGKQYDVRQFLDLGRFLLRSKLIPYRMGSILFEQKTQSTAHEICSEMIANAFTQISFPILPIIVIDEKTQSKKLIKRNTRLTTPSDFDYSPYFKIIKYPLFPTNSITQYRNLPWTDEYFSPDGKEIIKKDINEPENTDN